MKTNKIKTSSSCTVDTSHSAHQPPTLYYLTASVIALLTLSVYLPALKNGFVDGWDDTSYILENVHVQSLNWNFLPWALTNTKIALYWHPLTWFSHAIDYSLWGDNPLGHHLTSIILHTINTSIVIWLTITLLKVRNTPELSSKGSGALEHKDILIIAGATGLLFGIHPLHVESVAWIAQRKDLLYSLFYMLSIITYIHYALQLKLQQPFYASSHYYGTLGLFILALCSKPMAVTLPAVLLLLDWYPLKRISALKHVPIMLVEKLPFIVLSGIVSVIAIFAQKAGTMKPFESVSSTTRLLVVCRGLMQYLFKLIAPVNLLPLYPYPKDASMSKPEYLAAIFVVASLTILSVLIIKKYPLFVTIWSFFLISVSPVVGLFQHAGTQNMADRYIYLASIGPFFLMGLGTNRVWAKAHKILKYRSVLRPVTIAMLLSVTTLLSYLTVKQIGIWQDSIVIWNYLIKKEPGFREGYFRRGEAFGTNGQNDRAIEDFTTALSIDPNYGSAYVNRASIRFKQGQLDLAFEDATKAIAVEPKAADAYTIRGNVYYKKGQFDQAIAEYDAAISIRPSFHQAYLNRAVTHRDSGDIDRAITDFSTTLTLGEDSMNNAAAVYSDRGGLYMKKGIIDLAMRDYQKACDMGSNNACVKMYNPFQKR